MRNPFAKAADLEKRVAELEAENRNYTETITNALLDAAADAVTDGYTAALEIAAGQVSRAMTSAVVTGPDAGVFDPEIMGQIGRSIVEAGEAIWVRINGEFQRTDNFGIQPNGNYQVSFNSSELVVPPSRVFHARWSVDIASQRGVAPLSRARTLRRLLSRLETSLEEESNASVGYLLPIPVDAAAKNVEQLKKDLSDLKGKIAVIESGRGNWDAGSSYAPPRRDYELMRMGPSYPAGSVDLYRLTRDTALTACGYPMHLITTGDATSQREAWRRFLHGTVAPIGRIITNAAQRINFDIEISFEELFASDIQGRARAFQSLVAGGMDLAQAAAATGILSEDDRN